LSEKVAEPLEGEPNFQSFSHAQRGSASCSGTGGEEAWERNLRLLRGVMGGHFTYASLFIRVFQRISVWRVMVEYGSPKQGFIKFQPIHRIFL